MKIKPKKLNSYHVEDAIFVLLFILVILAIAFGPKLYEEEIDQGPRQIEVSQE